MTQFNITKGHKNLVIHFKILEYTNINYCPQITKNHYFQKNCGNRIQDRNILVLIILTKSRANIQECYCENLTANPLPALTPMSTRFGLPNVITCTCACIHNEFSR